MTEQTTEWRECAFAGEDTSVYVGTPRRLHQAYRVCHLLERVGIPTEDHFGLGRRPEDCARCPVPALVEAVEKAQRLPYRWHECSDKFRQEAWRAIAAALALIPEKPCPPE